MLCLALVIVLVTYTNLSSGRKAVSWECIVRDLPPRKLGCQRRDMLTEKPPRVSSKTNLGPGSASGTYWLFLSSFSLSPK